MLLFCDSFDHYTDLSQKYDNAGASWAVNAGNGRRGGDCVTNTANANTFRLGRSFAANSDTTVILGFAFKRFNLGNAGSRFVVRWKDDVYVHMSLVQRDDNKFEFYHNGNDSTNDNGTLVATSTAAVSANAYHYYEFKIFLHATVGTAELKVDGVTVLSYIGNTINATSGNNWCTNWQFGGSNDTGGWVFGVDDVVLMDGTGSHNKDFIGDVAVEAKFPTADGTYAEFTPSTGVNHYALVDENPPNTTDYNSSGTIGNRDTYTKPAVSIATGSIYAAVVNIYARLSAGGGANIKPLCRSAATDGLAGAFAAPGTYHIHQGIFETDPATAGVPFTVAGVNAAEFGQLYDS